MSLSYEPLWQMLSNMNISKMEFAKMIGMSNATLAKLSKNEPITLTTVDKICNQFNCPIENVVKHIQDIKYSESVFSIGTIILSSEIARDHSENLYLRKKTYVIFETTCYNKRISLSKATYKVAPIYKTLSRREDSSNIYFENVVIDGKPTSGYISLKNTLEISSGQCETKLGIMPTKYMQLIAEKLEDFSVK